MPGHPLAKRGAPHWPPYRPSDAPSGPMATASLTGHLLATYWPSGEASHWPKGEAPTGHRTGEPSPGPPPTGKRGGRGSLWPHGSSSPPLPGHRTGWGFSRAKGGDALLPVCLTPHLGTPIPLPPPIDWSPLPHFPPTYPTDWRPPTGQKGGRAYPLPHYLPDFPTGWPKGSHTPPWPPGPYPSVPLPTPTD
jgi:hypothetical protein